MGFADYSKLLIGSALVTGFVATSAVSQDRVLKVTNWAEYIGEETIANFEAEYSLVFVSLQ